MTDKDIVRYLDLVNRKLFIYLHSGVDWKPEYEREMEEIDTELAKMQSLMDQERRKFEARKQRHQRSGKG